MTAAQSASLLAKQMKLDGTSRERRLSSSERVAHENSTPEERAAAATAKLQSADAAIAVNAALERDASADAQVFIGSDSIAILVSSCQRAVTIEEMTLRAALRQARNEGFRAGWKARHKHPTL